MYEIFKELCEQNNVTPYRVSKDTGIGRSTFTDWKNGRCTPKRNKMQKIADYFGVSVERFYRVPNNGQEQYYIDDEAREMVDFMHKNPEYQALFDASRKLKKEDLQLIMDMIERMS